MPFYHDQRIQVSVILTDNGLESAARRRTRTRCTVALNNIEHRKTQVRRPQTNGFVERFNRTVMEEFLRPAFRQKLYESVETLQVDLDQWLAFYNASDLTGALGPWKGGRWTRSTNTWLLQDKKDKHT